VAHIVFLYAFVVAAGGALGKKKKFGGFFDLFSFSEEWKPFSSSQIWLFRGVSDIFRISELERK